MVNNFDIAKSWLEKNLEDLNALIDFDINEAYEHLISLSFLLQKDNFEIDQKDKTEFNKVKGCISEVYINLYKENDLYYFKASSNTLIIKGYIYIILKALSNLDQENLIKTLDLIHHFIDNLNMKNLISTARSGAFLNIYILIKEKVKELI